MFWAVRTAAHRASVTLTGCAGAFAHRVDARGLGPRSLKGPPRGLPPHWRSSTPPARSVRAFPSNSSRPMAAGHRVARARPRRGRNPGRPGRLRQRDGPVHPLFDLRARAGDRIQRRHDADDRGTDPVRTGRDDRRERPVGSAALPALERQGRPARAPEPARHPQRLAHPPADGRDERRYVRHRPERCVRGAALDAHLERRSLGGPGLRESHAGDRSRRRGPHGRHPRRIAVQIVGRQAVKRIHRVNTHRDDGLVVLYTNRFASSTRTSGGVEVVVELEHQLQPSDVQVVRIVNVRHGGNTPLQAARRSSRPARARPGSAGSARASASSTTRVVTAAGKRCGGTQKARGWDDIQEAMGGGDWTARNGNVAARVADRTASAIRARTSASPATDG